MTLAVNGLMITSQTQLQVQASSKPHDWNFGYRRVCTIRRWTNFFSQHHAPVSHSGFPATTVNLIYYALSPAV
jgi:hypothetical protein